MGIERPDGPYALEMTAGAAWPSADEDSFRQRADELGATLDALSGAREDWERHRHMLFGDETVWSGQAATAAAAEVDARTASMQTVQEHLRAAAAQAAGAADAIADAKKQVVANVVMAQRIIDKVNTLDADESMSGIVEQVVLKTYASNTEVIAAAAARLTAPPG